MQRRSGWKRGAAPSLIGRRSMSIVSASVIVAAMTVVAIAAMLLVRRRAPAGSYFEDGDRAAGAFGVLATGFALLSGFVVFLAFESYDMGSVRPSVWEVGHSPCSAAAKDYAHQQPSLTAKKLRRAEITAGAPTQRGKPTGVFATRERMRHAERALAQQAEASYTRMVSDWQAARPAKSNPAAPETTKPAAPRQGGRERDSGARITRPSKGNVARQTTSPLTPALRHVLDSRPPAA